MAQMTQKRRAILDYIGDGTKKKSQIVNRFETWYFYNANKHIGDVLSRMVNAGLLVREKKGHYRKPNPGVDEPQGPEDPDQLSLF